MHNDARRGNNQQTTTTSQRDALGPNIPFGGTPPHSDISIYSQAYTTIYCHIWTYIYIWPCIKHLALCTGGHICQTPSEGPENGHWRNQCSKCMIHYLFTSLQFVAILCYSEPFTIICRHLAVFAAAACFSASVAIFVYSPN